MTVPVPASACVCTHGGEHGVGASPGKPKPQDVAVVSPVAQHGTGTATAQTTTTNYILILFSSSSRAQNNTKLRLILGGDDV